MTPKGLGRLKLDEACRLASYADPNSPLARAMRLPASQRPQGWAALSGAPWTCGYGCTGEGIGPTTVWDQARADHELLTRVAKIEAQLARDLPWFAKLDPVRRDVLTNIAFNVGVTAEESWKTTLYHVAAGSWDAAAYDLAHEGKWNRDVGARADRLAAAMRTGVWP